MPDLDTAWVALSLSKHIGSKTLNNLMRHFHYDTRAILGADIGELRKVPGVGPKIAQKIKTIDLTQVERAIQRWQQVGLKILTPDDPAYPPRLRPLDDRPAALFVRGCWIPAPKKAIALVGTRTPSRQTIEITHNLTFALVESGIAIVSGLAAGIDSAAHRAVLPSPGAYPLAVLGSGVLNIYPSQNRPLAEAVLRRGALLSEVHPESDVNSPALVARNRIITGLSDAVIVVETGVDGGAMHAARFARAQKRPLYAVDIDASGNRALLDRGEATAIAPNLAHLPF